MRAKEQGCKRRWKCTAKGGLCRETQNQRGICGGINEEGRKHGVRNPVDVDGKRGRLGARNKKKRKVLQPKENVESCGDELDMEALIRIERHERDQREAFVAAQGRRLLCVVGRNGVPLMRRQREEWRGEREKDAESE